MRWVWSRTASMCQWIELTLSPKLVKLLPPKVNSLLSATPPPQVEPTGLLSVETALAKYRQGSVENGVQEPFADSAILTGRSDIQGLIAEW